MLIRPKIVNFSTGTYLPESAFTPQLTIWTIPGCGELVSPGLMLGAGSITYPLQVDDGTNAAGIRLLKR